MKQELDILRYLPEIDEISDEDLKKKVIKVWEILWAQSKFEEIEHVPVTVNTNYPHIVHNRSVIRMALKVADVLEEIHKVKVNRDILLASAALQDSSKLVEYEPDDGRIRLSPLGESFQHGFYAAHIALEVGLPSEVVKAIISHTYENSKFPTDLISKILFYVDQIDMAALNLDRWKKISFIFR
jgi:23S rRNA maturation-related 3'-5' exoribonuclease YhaM